MRYPVVTLGVVPGEIGGTDSNGAVPPLPFASGAGGWIPTGEVLLNVPTMQVPQQWQAEFPRAEGIKSWQVMPNFFIGTPEEILIAGAEGQPGGGLSVAAQMGSPWDVTSSPPIGTSQRSVNSLEPPPGS